MIRADWSEDPRADNVVTSDAAERALLGCLLLDPGLVHHVDGIAPETFRSKDRAAVWRAIAEMIEDAEPVDFITTAARLEASVTPPPKGSPGWLSVLSSVLDGNYCADAEEVAAYARIVKEAGQRRRLAALQRERQ